MTIVVESSAGRHARHFSPGDAVLGGAAGRPNLETVDALMSAARFHKGKARWWAAKRGD
jgi:hypothetical protein